MVVDSGIASFSLMPCFSADDEIADPIIVNGLVDAIHQTHNESSPLLAGRDNRAALARRGKVTMAALYAIQVFYSFFVM